MLSNRIEKTGKQKITRMFWTNQKACHQAARHFTPPLVARKPWRVKERSLHFAPGEQGFLKQAIQRGHYGRIGKWPGQSVYDIANTAFSPRPDNFHDAFFKVAERRKLRFLGGGYADFR
jgi:hypothetical protein